VPTVYDHGGHLGDANKVCIALLVGRGGSYTRRTDSVNTCSGGGHRWRSGHRGCLLAEEGGAFSTSPSPVRVCTHTTLLRGAGAGAIEGSRQLHEHMGRHHVGGVGADSPQRRWRSGRPASRPPTEDD